MSSPFESNSYYGISSNYYGPSFLLADGFNPDAPSTLSLTESSFSSTNWQIFYQDPIYLIRNYDYGAKYQLGIAEDSPTLPALLPASGNLTQQWNMTLWDDRTFRLANMWLGSSQILCVNGEDDTPVPVMTAAENGTHWSFSINLSNATSHVAHDMLQSVSLQAAPSSTSTPNSLSTLASTAVSRTPAEITVAATTITAASVSSSSTSASLQSTTPRSISGGAIAGIVVAVVALALITFGFLFLVRRRRRQQRRGLPADQAAFAQPQAGTRCTSMHEADTRHPPSEMGVWNDKEGRRSRAVEMPGSPVKEE